MSEEPDPFPHQVAICNMTWFSQVGLFLNDEERHRGSWVHKDTTQGIVKIVSHNSMKDNDAPALNTGYGPMILREDVHAWLDERQWSYKLGRTASDWNCQCKGVIQFKDSSHAMIFKLTWGGNV
jgi:hypothetical protein